jgi:hypothetical protein
VSDMHAHFSPAHNLPAPSRLDSLVMMCMIITRVQLIPALLDHPLSELASHVHFMPGVPRNLTAPVH